MSRFSAALSLAILVKMLFRAPLLLSCWLLVTSTTLILASGRAPLGRVVAYVGVRSGSDRCPHKNIKPFFNNKSILDLKLETLQQVTQLDEIVVSSDSKEMLMIARSHNKRRNQLDKHSFVPIRAILRDPYFCSDHVQHTEYFEHIADELHDAADHILYAPASAPLLEVKDFVLLIETFAKSEPEKHDAAAFFLKRTGYFWFEGKPVNCM